MQLSVALQPGTLNVEPLNLNTTNKWTFLAKPIRKAVMIRYILFICLVLLVLITVFQNTQVVEFRFLVWTISLSRALMLFGALAIGFVAGWLLRVPKQKKEQQGQSKREK